MLFRLPGGVTCDLSKSEFFEQPLAALFPVLSGEDAIGHDFVVSLLEQSLDGLRELRVVPLLLEEVEEHLSLAEFGQEAPGGFALDSLEEGLRVELDDGRIF